MKKSNNKLALLVAFTIPLSAHADINASAGCKANPAVVGQCKSVKGTIALHNGTPSIRIHLDKSKRVLGVIPAENEIMPQDLKEEISFEQSVHAQLLVCQLSPRRTGTMQSVCVESASNIKLVKP
ncbi:hypothetical protein ACNFH5_27995 [Pseudomonas sp. NY15435]|uniref:hypothetical protein n=1 Tax=Pseudomonas sp. NY15435 TaxID=3400358 RepID=UPI003A873920